jgi:hypothetical protein
LKNKKARQSAVFDADTRQGHNGVAEFSTLQVGVCQIGSKKVGSKKKGIRQVGFC